MTQTVTAPANFDWRISIMHKPTEAERSAMQPMRWVLFFRTFVLYQFYRFLWINMRMLRMVFKSHGG